MPISCASNAFLQTYDDERDGKIESGDRIIIIRLIVGFINLPNYINKVPLCKLFCFFDT